MPGIEEQTRKLFEVCRVRDVPIITLCQQARPRGPRPRSTCWTKSSSRSRST
jgi:peptide subunit release factor RF-3